MDVTTATESTVRPRPWATIWFAPRRTIREILAAEDRPSWVPVVAVTAAHQVLTALQRGDDGSVSLSHSFMPVTLGVAQVIFGILVGPFLMAWVAGWFGGEADADEIRHAVAWSYAPYAVSGVLWIPVFLAFGGPMRNDTLTTEQMLASLLLFGVVVAAIWTMVLNVVMFAEVERFSIARALACMVVLAIPLMILMALRG